MRIAGWAFDIDALPAERAWLAIGLPADFGSRSSQGPLAVWSPEGPLRWLPQARPPYQLTHDPRALGKRSPFALDHGDLTLFDRIRQQLEVPGSDEEAWDLLLRLGRDDAPANWQEHIRLIICAHRESAIPAILSRGGEFCDQALFSRVILALGPASIPALKHGLSHEKPDARAAAARGLAVWGVAAREASAQLREVAQHDPDDYTRFQAHRALAALEAN